MSELIKEMKKDPARKHHLSIPCTDATWPTELLQRFVFYFLFLLYSILNVWFDSENT